MEAIKAVTDIFKSDVPETGDFEFTISSAGSLLNENGFGNRLVVTPEQILENVQAIQQHNDIREVVNELQGMNFSVEMETGTGKTYVYLRTIYELNKLYGFRKFVIVVPSVAIREGVVKNLQITHEHFQSLYDRVAVTPLMYDSKKVTVLRGFATADSVQILVINIDAFAKDENIINKPNDKLSGKLPVEFIQSTHPVVIVDEPQNMETENRKRAITNLIPLCTLRYSATHTNLYNLVYSLNPVKAYDLGLVKQIEVDTVVSENAMNDAFVQVEKIQPSGKNKIIAKLKLDVNTGNGVVRKSVTVDRDKYDLYKLSGEREIYQDLKVTEIDLGNQLISLSNGQMLGVGEIQGGLNDEVLRYMVKKTVEAHLTKERSNKSKGIKVLTLFFIDKVKNYRDYDENGNPVKGKFAQWFEEIYLNEISKPAFGGLIPYGVEEIHNGYFSQDNKGRLKDTGGETQADDDTYKLIMQEKEKLLDINTPLRFIFSHSALREGWDNPNVFQICTLNETKSEIKKRQEIGRGMRLCVNQEGERIFDRNTNKLTVVANEHYDDFARALQNEIEEECGVKFGNRIKNKAERQKVNYRKGFDADPKFLEIWERIRGKTKYRVSYQTDELISAAGKAIKDMAATRTPAVRSTKQKVLITDEGVTGQLVSDSALSAYDKSVSIPDILSYIQSKTELTRDTILRILRKSERINDLLVNPQMFMDNTVASIRNVLHDLMIDGIKYEKIAGKVYEMALFDDEDWEIYIDNYTHRINNPEKTICDNYMPLDSGVENQFARDCESSENVEFYFKLPNWFKIPTPIGNYNPDWAVVFKGEKKIYFVAETKGEGQELLKSETQKIKCGREHFGEFKEVVYKQVSSVRDLSI